MSDGAGNRSAKGWRLTDEARALIDWAQQLGRGLLFEWPGRVVVVREPLPGRDGMVIMRVDPPRLPATPIDEPLPRQRMCRRAFMSPIEIFGWPPGRQRAYVYALDRDDAERLIEAVNAFDEMRLDTKPDGLLRSTLLALLAGMFPPPRARARSLLEPTP